MNLRRKIIATSAALVGTLGLMTFNGSQASAASSDCPDTKFCVWADSGYSGSLQEGSFAYSGYDVSYLGGMNDRTTSFWNRTGKTVAIFRDSSYQQGYSGIFNSNHHWCAEVRPGAYVSNIGASAGGQNWAYMNDAVSSFNVDFYCDAPVRIFY